MGYSGWKECKLGDILNFRRGHDLPKKNMVNGKYPVVGSNGVIGYHNEYTTESPCVTVGRSGNIGNAHILKKKCWAHNTTLYVDDFKGNDPEFIYYLLKTLNLGYYGGGSAVPTLNRNHIHPIVINYPEKMQEQKAIANILSTLDKKIETNNQINKNLEEMAQAIFKHWFVDFEFPDEEGKPYKSSGGEMVESELGMIPKGWEVKSIDDVASVVSKGTTPTKKDLNNAIDDLSIKFLKVKNIDDDGNILMNTLERIPNSIHYGKLKRSILKEWDILFSIAGTIGRVATVDHRLDNSNTNQAIAFIRLNAIEKMFAFILYLLKSENIQNEVKVKVVHAVQANASLGTIKSLKYVLPEDRVLKSFNNIVFPIYNEQTNIRMENEVLKNIRDTLLPKLMSGEIRVPLNSEGDAS